MPTLRNNSAPSKKNTGSYPFKTVIVSLTLPLVVLGLLGLLMTHAAQLASAVQSNVEVQVYLSATVAPTERSKLLKLLALEPYVLQGAEAKGIQLITKEEAAEQFMKDTGEDFMKLLGENPLKDLVKIKVKPAYSDTASLSAIRQRLTAKPGITEVQYDAGLTTQIKDNLLKISAVLVGFAILLSISAIFMINTTIRLAMFSQRFLIRSMLLVGATHWYIQRPFLARSIFYGLVAAIVAFGLVFLIQWSAYQRIPELQDLRNPVYEWLLVGCLTIGGVLLSTISSYFATSKYLRMSLDELY
jgi:cell division transport system permease protein